MERKDAPLDKPSLPLDHARALLRELLYKTREAVHSARPLGGGTGLCGLGDPAAVFQGIANALSPALQGLFSGQDASRQKAVIDIIEAWLREQDGLDRDRNHFLKKFRHEHGFDRRKYDADTARRFEEGLAAVNERQAQSLDACARKLLDLVKT